MNIATRRARASRVVRACITATVATTIAVVTCGNAHADAARSTSTPDGVVTVSLRGDNVQPIPPLNGSPLSHEGFVSAVADGKSSGSINSGTVEAGVEIGCALDMNNGFSLGLGTNLGPTFGFDPGPDLTMNATVSPNINLNLKPGEIVDVVAGKKSAGGKHVTVSFDQFHIKADGCIGAVNVRPYATYTASTNDGDHAVTTYGPVRSL